MRVSSYSTAASSAASAFRSQPALAKNLSMGPVW
jgi:hypothetical protein